MWKLPTVTGSFRVGTCRVKSHAPMIYIMVMTDLAITSQPIVQIRPFKMCWKARTEFYAAMVVCQWCHVTLPPSSKTQSSRCGFELKAHIMRIVGVLYYYTMLQTTISQQKG
jgi:hypothetical protein